MAKIIAPLISRSRDLRRRAAITRNRAQKWALLEDAKDTDSIIGFNITNIENPANFLRVLADTLDGKPLWSKKDVAINIAIGKAIAAKPYVPVAVPVCSLSCSVSEIDNKMAVVLTQLGINKKPSKETKHERDALRRRLNARGIRPRPEPGRKKLPRPH